MTVTPGRQKVTHVGDAAEMRVLYDGAFRPTYQNPVVPGGPAGWHSDINFDDSAWLTKSNGAGSVATAAPTPDGRAMPAPVNFSPYGGGTQTLIHWNSSISPDGTNFVRIKFNLTADDIAAGISITIGAHQYVTGWVNGVEVCNTASLTQVAGLWEFPITGHCVTGQNFIALRVVDYPTGSGESTGTRVYGQNQVLDTMAWVHVFSPHGGLTSEEEEVVIGGPFGDPSPFATTNKPGGIMQPGWERGLRHGYAQDGDFIFDENSSGVHFCLPVPLDCKHILTLYDYLGGSAGPYYLAALMVLEDGELIDVARDIPLVEQVESFGPDDANYDACLLSFADGVGYVAFCYAGAYGANSHNVRVSILKIDINGIEPVVQVVETSAPLTYDNYRTVYDVVRLSDTKFVVSYEENDASLAAFTTTGASSGGYTGLAVQVFEYANATLSFGTPLVVGATPTGMCAVSESRILLAAVADYRSVWKTRSLVPGTTSLYLPGLTVRTADVSGLSLTENTATAAVQADVNADLPYYTCVPTVKMLDAGTAVVVYARHAQLAPTVHYHHATTGARTPGAGYGLPQRYNTDGTLNQVGRTGHPYYGSEAAPEVPAALRFAIGVDGSVSSSHVPHILDASPSRYKPIDYWTTGDTTGLGDGFQTMYFSWVSGFQADVADGYMAVAWAEADMNAPYNSDSLDALFTRKHNWIFVATTIALDDASPSGLTSPGFRHLGYDWNSFTAQLNFMRLRNMPGTDWFVGHPDPWSSALVDGNIEGGAIPEGFPDNFWELNDWDYYQYPFKPPYWSELPPDLFDTFLRDYWDEENMADYEPKFGTYASDARFATYTGNHPRSNAYRDQTVRLTPYRIPPPQVGEGSVQGLEQRVMRQRSQRRG